MEGEGGKKEVQLRELDVSKDLLKWNWWDTSFAMA